MRLRDSQCPVDLSQAGWYCELAPRGSVLIYDRSLTADDPARQTDTIRRKGGGCSERRGAESSAGLPSHLRGLDHPAERQAPLRGFLRAQSLPAEGP